ncbi:MAG: tyrosine-type recombinase/integrase [Gemmataceae bacterium]
MRRPNPRFDARRNAWVTRAGGKLVTLAIGPKNARTEAQAWDAFYSHMARLGNPVQASSTPSISIGKLADEFGAWLLREIDASRLQTKTLEYYQHQLQKFLDSVGGNRSATSIRPHELEMIKGGWHSVQAVQRLYNWGVQMGLVPENPFRKIKKPDPGHRQRVLTDKEQQELLAAADEPFRQFLLAMLNTIARPQEIRALRWRDLVMEPQPMFVLHDFKARKRRKDRQTAVRRIFLNDFMLDMLQHMRQKQCPGIDDHVFLDKRGRAWTGNAIRCRMRRLRKKLGWTPDENGENVVAYSLRHTGATRASVLGVSDRSLSELMGHTTTSMTRRYQHPPLDHLGQAIRQATGDQHNGNRNKNDAAAD